MARSPYIRHSKHREVRHTRQSRHLLLWVAQQATRIGVNAAQLFSLLRNAQKIENYGAGAVPVNTAVPAITGTTQNGQTLTASNGTWTGSPVFTYAYQWKRAGANIAGATAKTRVLQVADVGTVITVTVTATNAKGNASATSAGTAAIT